jgi:hypothetical protein
VPKGQKKAAGAVREGSKTAQVVAMLQRKNGATLTEIMDKMGWQKHTVRGPATPERSPPAIEYARRPLSCKPGTRTRLVPRPCTARACGTMRTPGAVRVCRSGTWADSSLPSDTG